MRYNDSEQQAIDEAVRKLLCAEPAPRIVWWRAWLCVAISAASAVLVSYLEAAPLRSLATFFIGFSAAMVARPYRRPS